MNQVGTPPNWVWLESAHLMLEQIFWPHRLTPTSRDVLSLLRRYTRTHQELSELGYQLSEIRFPFYMPHGECRMEDPDNVMF